MPLTNLTIKNANAADKAYKLFDKHGLYLLVAPSGGKLWRYKYRFADREKMLCLGQYPAMGLVEAREQHAVARKLVLKRLDPDADQRRRHICAVEPRRIEQ